MHLIKENQKKINLLIAGTQKGGTTVLHHYLRQHPEIWLHPQKELHFFDDESYWDTRAGSDNYIKYHEQFMGSAAQKWIGEATPIYMYWDKCAERMCKYNPHIKIILILRDPSKRAYSQWVMEKKRGEEHRSFSECIMTEIEELQNGGYLQDRVKSYVSRGFYGLQLKRLLLYFSIKQIHILKTDSLRNQQSKTLAQIWQFLEVENYSNIRNELIFSNQYDAMSTFERELLIDQYRSDITELNQLCNIDSTTWLHC